MIEQLTTELNYLFKTSRANNRRITIYTDTNDSDDGQQPYLTIIKNDSNSNQPYSIDYHDTNNIGQLTQQSLKKEHKQLNILYHCIQRRNSEYKQQQQNSTNMKIAGIIGCLAFLALLLSAVFTGGLSLLGGAFITLGAITAISVSSSLASYFSLKLVNKFKQWRANQQKFTTQEQEYTYRPLAKTTWQKIITPLTLLNSFLKWLSRLLIFDNFLSKYLIGSAIAKVANHGNDHYKIEAKTLTKTLGPLIFAAGLTKPHIDEHGDVYLGPILSKQLLDNRKFQTKVYDERLKVKTFKIKLPKGQISDGITVYNKNSNIVPDLHLIYFNGNSGCFEQDANLVENDLLAYANKGKNVHATQFNYPGVLHSNNKLISHAQDLIECGIAQVERLNKKYDIPYDKIGLRGVSLGGSLVSHVASYYNKRGIQLNGTYASKTFSSTTNVAISYVQKIPYVGHFLGYILRPIIAIGLWGSRWQLDTAAHYASLPPAQRDYSVVRSSKQIRRDYSPIDDPVLAHTASLHQSWRLKLERFFHKHGWLGFNKDNYKKTNKHHKMSVYESSPNLVNNKKTLAPHICGHSKVSFNHSNHHLFLHHRGTGHKKETTVILPAIENNCVAKSKIKVGFEAGQRKRCFFRKNIQKRNCFWKNSTTEPTRAKAMRKLVSLI